MQKSDTETLTATWKYTQIQQKNGLVVKNWMSNFVSQVGEWEGFPPNIEHAGRSDPNITCIHLYYYYLLSRLFSQSFSVILSNSVWFDSIRFDKYRSLKCISHSNEHFRARKSQCLENVFPYGILHKEEWWIQK